MILGESLILTGKNTEGIEYIKEGWITAELSNSELNFTEKNTRNILMQMITLKS